MVIPHTTPKGRAKRYQSWRAALEAAMRGLTEADFPRTRGGGNRVDDLIAYDEDAAFALLHELAEGAWHIGDMDAAKHYQTLADEMAEYLATPRSDNLPWEEVHTMSEANDVLAQAKATLEAAGYKVQQRKPATRRKRREIETLTDAEIEALFAEANPTRWEGQRDRAIMALLLATGLRVGEALSLEPDDLTIREDGSAVVSVPDAAGCKTGHRPVPFRWLDASGNPTQTAVELSAWIVARPESEFLFCTRVGNQLHRNGFNRSLQTYARRAGIEKHMHSHLFRHTYATRRIAQGWTQAEVQQALGHRSPNTTSIYVECNIDRLTELVMR